MPGRLLPQARSLSRQYDFREVRLTSGAQRGLASSRPEPHVLSGTNERGGQPWVSLARCSSSVSTSTRTPSPSPTRRRSHREYAPLSGLYLSHVLIGKSAARAL